jgi:HTH-type transcriptional regulator, transcriptional repressor of NAD biosynthesis genes
MTTGLVLGKFNPLHTGHIKLIEFAALQCDKLFILVCASNKEKIPGKLRLQWIKETFSDSKATAPLLLNYKEDELPNTSVSSKAVSAVWSQKIKTILPGINIIFSSEKYGDYVAEYLGCKHILYDVDRKENPFSASEILNKPFKNWNYIAPAAKPYFVKKICIYGTESTGKSTLTEFLSFHYNTSFVSEAARDIVAETDECTEDQLQQIAASHAHAINDKIKSANKILIVDTDINITRSYSKYLFKKPLQTAAWINEANTFDLYIFLDNDAPYIQDGTRLDKKRRDLLHDFHKKELEERAIAYKLVSGNWEERFEKSKQLINNFIEPLS